LALAWSEIAAQNPGGNEYRVQFAVFDLNKGMFAPGYPTTVMHSVADASGVKPSLAVSPDGQRTSFP